MQVPLSKLFAADVMENGSAEVLYRGKVYMVLPHAGWQGPFQCRIPQDDYICYGSMSEIKDNIRIWANADEEA